MTENVRQAARLYERLLRCHDAGRSSALARRIVARLAAFTPPEEPEYHLSAAAARRRALHADEPDGCAEAGGWRT